MKHTVSDGQDVFDIAIQRYGSVELGLFELLNDNDNLTINDSISSGDEFDFNNTNIGEKQVISYFSNRNFVINNADELQLETVLGAYNNEFGNGYDNTTL